MPQINELSQLEINEISLVDAPANPGSEVLLFKRDSDTEVPIMADVEKTVGETPATPDAPDRGVVDALIAKSEERMDQLSQDLVEKSEVISRLEAENQSLREQIENAASVEKRAPEDDSLESVLKQAPEAVQKALESLTERVAKAEAETRQYAEQIEKREWIAKAEPFVKSLPTSAETLGGLLQRVAKGMTTTEDAAELERVFAAVNSAAMQGGVHLFKSLGRDSAEPTSAKAKIEMLAEDIQKSASGITPEQATAKVLAQHPELYADYLTEQRAVVAA
jgi:chromosome segregation ATPase